MPEIKTISSREVYRNQWTRVREDVIERANGERGIYGVVERTGVPDYSSVDDGGG